MKSNFRQAYVYNLDVETKRRPAVLPSMNVLLDVLEKRLALQQASLALNNGDAHITLGDVVRDPASHTAALLFRHSDRYAADSVYSNIAGNTFRAHAKNVGEGGEMGVHLLVSTAPERAVPGRYTAMLEKSQNLNAGLIRRLINRLLHDEYDANPAFFSYDSPAGQRDRAGNVIKERTLPRIELDGQPSQTLAHDLQQGRLTGITLLKAVPHIPVAGIPYLTKQEASLKIAVDQHNLGGNIWGDVRRAIAAEAGTFPIAQIGVQLPGRKKVVSVKVDSATGNPLTEMYVKSHDIWNINPPMASSAQAVVLAFVDRIRPLLIRERSI
jgi:hypothetical protein